MLPAIALKVIADAWLLASGIIQGIEPFLTETGILPTPVIPTADGPVQGKLGLSRSGLTYWQFLGIPYAESPTGSLRFQPPVPVKSWKRSGVKIVNEYPPACPQVKSFTTATLHGQENCLFLNVFAPVQKKNLPVLVHFHGGAFSIGQTSWYHPRFLMDHQLIVVTVQYRLGPLGFLNLRETNSSYPRGNMGLKDQTLALKWVQRNIQSFGGNPKQVSIMGQSAGAASVGFHMMSKSSQGLFHRAIALSGSPLAPWAFSTESRKIANSFAKGANCSKERTTELWHCLQNLEVEQLLQNLWSIYNPSLEMDGFVPSLEPIETNDTFLGDKPRNLMKNGKMASVPLLIGLTSGEGSIRSARLEAMPELIGKLDRRWQEFIGRFLYFEEDINLSPEIAGKLRNFYFGNRSLLNTDMNFILKKFTELASDALFNEPAHTMAVENAKTGKETYLFYFDYETKLLPSVSSYYKSITVEDGDWGIFKFLQDLAGSWISEKLFGMEDEQREIYGVGHGKIGLQIWSNPDVTLGLVEVDREFSEHLVKSLVDFVSGRKLKFRDIDWPMVNSSRLDNLPYMKMTRNGHGKVIPEPFAHRMKFWEEITALRESQAGL